MAVRTASSNGIRRLGDPRDVTVATFEIEKEDIMKFKPIYEALYLFLDEEGFKHPQGGEPEELYWERWTSQGAKEQHLWWRVKKDVNKYIRYLLIINIQTLNTTKAEVAYKNKKVSAEKTDFIMRGELILQWDISDLFKNSIAYKFRNFFYGSMYKQEIEERKNDLRAFGLKLQRMVKQYFEMNSDAEYPQMFQPAMGYKE